MAITTTGIGPMDVNPSPKSKAKEKDETAADAFSTLMNAAAMNTTEKSPVTGTTNEKVDVSGASGVPEAKKTDYKTDSKAEVKDDKNSLREAADNSNVKENVETEGKKNISDTDRAEDKADVSETALVPAKEAVVIETDVKDVISELTDIVKDLLDIDDEELDKLLAETGYVIQDLMLKTNLNDFILQVNDATSVDALINENLNNLLKNASQVLDNLLEKFDISDVDVEQFIDTANVVLQNTEAVSEETVVSLADDEAPVFEKKTEEAVTVKPETESRKAPLETKKDDERETKVTVKNGEKTDTEDKTKVTITADTESEGFTGQEKQDTKAGERIIDGLNQAINNIADADMVNPAESFTNEISEADIVRQIIDDIKVNMSSDTTSLELQLNPEHLGKVQISVSTKNGVMQAQIVTENEAARHAVEASIQTLKEAFDNQGLKVDAVEVMVATYEFFGNGEEQADSDNTNRNAAGQRGIMAAASEEEPDEAEALEQEMMQAQGNTVSYMA